MSVMLQERGFLQTQIDWYENWTGKFTGMLFISAFLSVFDLVEHYVWAPLLMILGTFGGLYLVGRRLAPAAGRWSSVWFAGLSTAFVLAGLPAPRETVFWLTAAYSYHAGSLLLLLLVALSLHTPRTQVGRAANAFSLLLAGLLAAGTSETLMILLVLASGGWFLLGLFRVCPWSVGQTALLVGVCSGGAIMFLAPGNTARGSLFEHSQEFWTSLSDSFVLAARLVKRFTLNVPLIGASLLALGAMPIFLRATRGLRPTLRRCPFVVVALITFAAVAAGAFPAFWAMDAGPPNRARASIWVCFLLLWFGLLLPSLWFGLRRRVRFGDARLRKLGGALLAVGLLVQSNVPRAWDDILSLRAYRYSMENRDRYAALAAAESAGQEVVQLRPLENRPRTISFNDLFEDPMDWRNVAFARFFGVRAVTCKRIDPR